MKPFRTFNALSRAAIPGRDFLIERRRGTSGIAVMAPHGGGIEPGTDIIARAVAGDEHSLYAFIGIRKTDNRMLHLPSHLFDEPDASAMAGDSDTIVTLHGCKGERSAVFIGGRDERLGERMMRRLKRERFHVERCAVAELSGTHPENLCNRGKRGRGVQLELSLGLRQRLCGKAFDPKAAWGTALMLFSRCVRDALGGGG
jgi:phage replication-related protein YjqB (UPF0714/DUF867 family)